MRQPCESFPRPGKECRCRESGLARTRRAHEKVQNLRDRGRLDLVTLKGKYCSSSRRDRPTFRERRRASQPTYSTIPSLLFRSCRRRRLNTHKFYLGYSRHYVWLALAHPHPHPHPHPHLFFFIYFFFAIKVVHPRTGQTRRTPSRTGRKSLELTYVSTMVLRTSQIGKNMGLAEERERRRQSSLLLITVPSLLPCLS